MAPGETNSNQTEENSIESLEQEYNMVFNKLRPRIQAFITSYHTDLNSKRAAETAGYSKKTAMSQGSRLLRKSNISLLVSLQQRINSLKGKLTTAWVLTELKARYEDCVLASKHQAATANLNLIGQHLGMFGKGKEDKGDLHLHQHYVDYPPVPDTIQAWVQQMREVGYSAMLPEHGEDTAPGEETPTGEEI